MNFIAIVRTWNKTEVAIKDCKGRRVHQSVQLQDELVSGEKYLYFIHNTKHSIKNWFIFPASISQNCYGSDIRIAPFLKFQSVFAENRATSPMSLLLNRGEESQCEHCSIKFGEPLLCNVCAFGILDGMEHLWALTSDASKTLIKSLF